MLTEQKHESELIVWHQKQSHLRKEISMDFISYFSFEDQASKKWLDMRIVKDGIVQCLSSDRSVAKIQIKALLSEGYELLQDETGNYYLSQAVRGGSPLDILKKKLDQKPVTQRSVFITYQWRQKDIAIALHQAFEAKGFLVIRDESTLEKDAYLPDFMRIIGHKNLDYVLPVISNSYLKSRNCMYEVNQILNCFQWERTLLPYVISQNPEVDSHIYSGVGPYIEYWQQELEKEKDQEEKKFLSRILENLRPFAKEIISRLHVSELELIQTNYEVFFEVIAKRERERFQFDEIEEYLRIASISEKKKQHDKAKRAFENAISKLDDLEHLESIQPITGKVYGLYGEYFLRQAKERLEVAANFGYEIRNSIDIFSSFLDLSPKDASATSPTVASQDLQTRLTRVTSKAQHITHTAASIPSTITVSQTATMPLWQASASANNSMSRPVPAVDAIELKKFLTRVAHGEQNEAEELLRKNKDIALVSGRVADLSDRIFSNITGFQYAVWALDWHMWRMIQQYMPEEVIRSQLHSLQRGVCVDAYGVSVNWESLIQALDKVLTYIQAERWDDCQKCWQQEVGQAQRALPAHVVNEYCHPERSFNHCPNFAESKSMLRRARNTDDGEWFTVTHNNGRLGETFAHCRGSMFQAQAWGYYYWDSWMSTYVTQDRQACYSLLVNRTNQREQLLTQYVSDHRLVATAP